MKFLFILLSALIFSPEAKTQQKVYGNEISVINDIEFKKTNDTTTLKLDVYTPAEIGDGKRPAVIFVHGGGFWEGDKRSPLYVKMAMAFARCHYVSFSVNYTLKEEKRPYSRTTLDTCMSDVAAAVRWIKANGARFGVDTANIFICGDSAGGGIVVNLSYNPAYNGQFAGCIDLWGGLPGKKGWNARIFTGAFTKNLPPTYIAHGTKDRIIPYGTSLQLAKKLRAKGVFHELHRLKNADHYPVQMADIFIPLMIKFADKISGRQISDHG